MPTYLPEVNSPRVGDSTERSLQKINSLLQGFQNSVNVLSYGADSTGVGNSSAAVTAAVAAVATLGGTVYFPAGSYRFNITINNSNVQFLGAGATLTGSLGTIFFAWDTTIPIIRVANDTVLVQGVNIRGILLDGESLSLGGIYYQGGAKYCFANGVVLKNFTERCVSFLGGTNLPTLFIWFQNFIISQNNSGTSPRGVFVQCPSNTTQYTTAIYFQNGSIVGPTTKGFALEIDGCSIRMASVYCDLTSTFGFKLSKSAGTNTNIIEPYILGDGLALDSAVSTDILVKTWDTSGHIVDALRGNITVDGKIQFSDGGNTSIQITGNLTGVYRSTLEYPFVDGSLAFRDAANAFEAYNQSNTISVTSGRLTLLAATDVLFSTKAQFDFNVKAQAGVDVVATTGTTLGCAGINLTSTTTGIMLPRLTKTQRNAIASPANGLMVYQTDAVPGIVIYASGAWAKVTAVADP